jgi:fatty acid amide hydrolase 2
MHVETLSELHLLNLVLQVVAAPYKDHLCIAIAKELQKAFGGWVPPFPV